jgi:TonB family protein
MSNLSDDILKYKKGELSPKETHALEKKALSDPFLADALEGSDYLSLEEFSSDVQSINEKIKGGGRASLFTPLRIAAGILLFAVAYFIVYQLTPKTENLALTTNKEKKSTQIDSQKVSSAVAKTADSALRKPVEKKPEVLKAEPKQYIAKAKEKNPEPIMSSASGKNTLSETNSLTQVSDQPGKLMSAKPAVSAETAAGNIQPSVQEEKESKLDVASAPTPSLSNEAKRKEVAQSSRMAKAIKADIQKMVSGQVLSAEDGSPIPGVNVMLKGTTQGTVTDASGYFQMNLNQQNQPLVFSFIGYESQEINALEKDKIEVALKEDATQLSEVVVTGVSSANESDREPIIKGAEPIGGLKAYDKYLDDNLRYPQQALENKIKGKVVIEFTVLTDGSLDEFNVIKKLGFGCDEEVIRLVKEGPMWKPGTRDNVAVENSVRVKMKFNPEKKK